MNRASRIRPWLELIRVPNLLTVPGDPLAGALVASAGAGVPAGVAACAMGASLCLYAAGLLHNDWCDLEIDRRERPGRPLPRGAVRVGAAMAAAAVLASLGLLLAAMAGWWSAAVACALAVAIVLYNGTLKRGAAGPIAMGACRGLSFLLGAAAGGGAAAARVDVAIPSLGLTAYIAAVTAIAAREMEVGRRVTGRWLPVAVLAIAYVALVAHSAGASGGRAFADPGRMLWFASMSVAALATVGVCGWRLGRPDRPGGVPPVIGRLIRALIPLQVSLCAWGGGLDAAGLAALVVLWPAAAWLGRRFYAS